MWDTFSTCFYLVILQVKGARGISSQSVYMYSLFTCKRGIGDTLGTTFQRDICIVTLHVKRVLGTPGGHPFSVFICTVILHVKGAWGKPWDKFSTCLYVQSFYV